MLRTTWGAFARALVVVLFAPLTVVAASLPAAASASGDIISYTNSARANHGLARYSVSSDLSRLAQEHANWMAAHQSLQHTSNLSSKVCCWRSVGENVGYGSTAREVFNAFMGSSSHRANILSSRFTQIGVGVARSSNGYLYVDQIFRQPTHSSGSTTAPPPRASRSTTRAPLRVSQPARPVMSPAERRLVQFHWRMQFIHPPRQGDPLARCTKWLRAMQFLTAA